MSHKILNIKITKRQVVNSDILMAVQFLFAGMDDESNASSLGYLVIFLAAASRNQTEYLKSHHRRNDE